MKHFTILLSLFALMSTACGQLSWTHFRGNELDGHAEGQNYPINFGEDENIIWKIPVEGVAWSSPVIWGNQIWLTNATRNGDKLSVVCVDYKTGNIIKDILLFEPAEIQNIHATNSYATPTPAIEKDFVYVHYGTYGTACINTNDFSVAWTRTDMNCQHMQGAASSVVIHNNMLLVHIEGTDVQYVAALDKSTGKTIWKTERPQEFHVDIAPVYRKAYTTAFVVEVNGREQLISNGAQLCISYDVNTGEELWRLFYGHDSTVGMPLAYNGLVFFNSGWIFEPDKPSYVKFYAVDPRGKGDIAETHLKWQSEEDIPQITTPIIVDGFLYMVHERGALSCLDAMTGEVIWKEKLRGQFNASPVFAGGHIYIPEVRGTVYVLKPGNSFQLVAENKMDGTLKATPAYVDGNIILRTENHLYRIGKE